MGTLKQSENNSSKSLEHTRPEQSITFSPGPHKKEGTPLLWPWSPPTVHLSSAVSVKGLTENS